MTTTTDSQENTSGMGKDVPLPPSLKGWNWGAFFFTWVWGLGNSSYWPFLFFVPFGFLFMPFVCGAKGNRWAWENRIWRDETHFRQVQRKWTLTAIIGIPLVICVLIGVVTTLMKNSEAYQMALREVRADDRVREAIGEPIKPGFFVAGSIEVTGGGAGKASISFSVSGPEGKGKVYAEATKAKYVWEIHQLAVRINSDNRIIGVIPTESQLGDRGALFRAVLNDDVATVKRLLGKGTPVDCRDEAGCTPLHTAALNGRTAIAQTLLDAGADVNAPGAYGLTPLCFAADAKSDYPDVVRVLLGAGADTTVRNPDGETPMDAATEKGHTNVVAVLQEATTSTPTPGQ